MIQGFGQSVWAVPLNYRAIQEKYGMKHIPHVTISTNHPSRPIVTTYNMPCTIIFSQKLGLVRLPKMYEHDPFSDRTVTGFYCRIPDIKEDTLTHMTMSYDFHEENYTDYKPPEFGVPARIIRADTTSENPAEWFIY